MLTERQRAIRMSGLGSSEISSVAGENPFKGPHDVWLVKRGLAEDFGGNGKTWIGHMLEAPLAHWYAEETGAPVRKFGRTVRSKEHPFALATPDFRRVDFSRLAECKAVGFRVEHHWDRSRPDGVPPYVLLQGQWQMGIVGIHRLDVVVCFLSDGEKLIYELTFDPAIFASLITIGARFWRLVETGEPPAPDASEACKEVLQKLYTRPRDELVPAPDGAADAFARRLDADDRKEAAKKDADLASNQLRALIGDAAGFEGDFGRVTWKPDKNGQRVLRLSPRKEKDKAA
ncbi:MAG: hypothetical protein HOV80_36515 [Polyangiaceae bacterium]|nr:hypothetical protein [Polyangiaceae bacterium]